MAPRKPSTIQGRGEDRMREQELMVERENPDATDPDEIRHYIRIYSELRAFKQSLVERANQFTRTLSGEAQEILGATDIPEFQVQVDKIDSRLLYWQERFWQLHGVDLDAEYLEMRHRGRTAELTKREFQLLSFLLSRPDQYVRPRQLVAGAWHDDALSEEQLRTYVSRVRKQLEDLAVPVMLATDRRRGYILRSTHGQPNIKAGASGIEEGDHRL